jgi:hypothetical protein
VNEVCIFPSSCSFRQINPLDEPLDNWFIVPRDKASLQQSFRLHLDIALSVSEWEIGLWNHFISNVLLKLANVEDRVNGAPLRKQKFVSNCTNSL